MSRRLLVFAMVLGVAISLSAVCWAQVTSGTILGAVRDTSGAVVPGAKVTVTNVEKGTSLVYQTDQTGLYRAPFLIPGIYSVRVEKPGFRAAVRNGITLQVDQQATINFMLSVGAVSQQVSVTAAAPLVESQSSSLGQVITKNQVEDLPLNGRDWGDLVYLVSGVTPGEQGEDLGGFSTFNPRGTSSFEAEGGQENGNAWLIDGIVDNEYSFDTTMIKPSIESIQEFKVLTGTFSAEFGDGPGVVIASTRSGTNQFHGSAMDFLRNTALNARNYFAAPNQPNPPFIRNQFEATLGGPVIIPTVYNGHNHTFVFLDYYGERQIQGISNVNTVPTLAARQGDFSQYTDPSGNLIPIYNPLTTTLANGQPVRQQFAGNIIPPDLINPVGLRVASIYPLPNAPGNFLNYFDTADRTIDDNGGNVRVDHVFGPKDTFFARFSYERYDLTAPQGESACCLPSNPTQAKEYDLGPWVSGLQETSLNANGLSVNETHIFSPNVVNEFRTGYARMNTVSFGSDYGDYPDNGLGIQNVNISPLTSGLSNLWPQGFTGLGGGPDWLPAHPLDTTSQIGDDLSWVKGRHQFKFGFRGVHIDDMQLANEETRGDIYFEDNFTNNPANPCAESGSGIATLLLGYSTSGTRGFLDQGPFYLSANWYSGYVQDNWKATSRLTLNLGLRYDIFDPPHELHNRLVNFDPSTDTLIYAGVNGVSSVGDLQTRYGNFQPRIGFALDPTGSGKTAIRGGFGIISFPLPNSASEELPVNVPWLVSQGYAPDEYPLGSQMSSVPTIADPFGPPVAVQPLTTAQLNAANPYVQAQNFSNLTPYMESYSLSVQHQLTPGLLFQVGYQGSRGIHLLESGNLNEVEPGPGSLASRRLIPSLGNVTTVYYMFNGNMSNYNSLQVKLQKNFSHGMQFLLNYTYEKSLDYSGSEASGNGTVYGPQTMTDRKAAYALSGFDHTQVLVGNWIYRLPFGPGHRFVNQGPLSRVVGGWEFDGIGTLYTGYPFSVELATGVTNGAASWPNRICSGKLGSPDPSAWFNTSCFVPPPTNTYGNVSRTPLFGPGTINFDTALAKNFKLTERFNLAFRAEAFNTFNTPNFAMYVNGDWGLIGLPDANTITGTFIDNREFELSLKLTF
ncbi:MAG: carboxypeptidase regulatory-like domain-containing protein [Terriglobia bacterium]